MKIKLLALGLALAIIVGAFAGCASVKQSPDSSVAPSQAQDGDGTQNNTENDDNAEKETITTSATYVSLDINPEISLTVDELNVVTGVFAENEDAQVLLYGEEELVGTDLEAAIEKITSLAVELGYIDDENKVVGVMVSGDSEEAASKIVSKIEEKIQGVAQNSGIDISISEDGAYSLLCELEELKALHPESKKIQDLTPSRFKLAKTAFEAGEMTIEEAVEMENEELIQRVDKAFNRIDKFATKAYEEARKNAEKTYEAVVGLALEGVYAEFYMKNIEKYPSTYYYGMLYQLYIISQRGYTELAEKLAKAEEIKNCELTAEQTEQIAEALGIENVDELANANGEITIESVENFADKRIKNSHKSEELDRIKDKLKGKLKEVKEEIEDQIDVRRDQYSNEKNDAATCGDYVVKALEMAGLSLSDEAKAELETYINEYKKIVSASDKITAEKAQEIAELMKQRAEELLNKIENDLSQEDKAAIEARKAEITSSLTEARVELENAVQDAEKQAKEHLEQEKENRRKTRK